MVSTSIYISFESLLSAFKRYQNLDKNYIRKLATIYKIRHFLHETSFTYNIEHCTLLLLRFYLKDCRLHIPKLSNFFFHFSSQSTCLLKDKIKTLYLRTRIGLTILLASSIFVTVCELQAAKLKISIVFFLACQNCIILQIKYYKGYSFFFIVESAT